MMHLGLSGRWCLADLQGPTTVCWWCGQDAAFRVALDRCTRNRSQRGGKVGGEDPSMSLCCFIPSEFCIICV